MFQPQCAVLSAESPMPLEGFHIKEKFKFNRFDL